MKNRISILLIIFCVFVSFQACAQQQKPEQEKKLVLGAEQVKSYKALLFNKKVALVVNQTSMVGDKHLVDVMLENDIEVKKVFAPEHGFRGQADAGEKVESGKDPKTGLPIVSLYGKNKKPTAEQLADVDVVIFDIQDVGVRFYTYISTMHYVMEACAENNKHLIVLDRPNPNGDYIDGPVLEEEHRSFVGMHPIPIVHGLTVGELAGMINGEGWLEGGLKCELSVIRMENYTHHTPYELPVKPSPNLPNQQSIRLYPSLALFEGTSISVGRGTYMPFQVVGYPDKRFGEFSFMPESIEGMAKYPKHEGKTCYGVDLRNITPPAFTLRYLLDFYRMSDFKEEFFNNFFEKLAGTSELRDQIKAGFDEQEIRLSWQEDLTKYKEMRKVYLLYPEK
jgi:uncharacterized protein YbbC (DUF1343 family)